MNICVGDKNYCFSEDELDFMYHGEGNEAVIYRLGSKVLKIYKDYCKKDRLDFETANFLKTLVTKRVLLPEELIYTGEFNDLEENELDLETKKFIGYTIQYKDSYFFKHLAKTSLKKFKSEVENIKEDIDLLTENSISVCDLNKDNTLYDGNIYLCDPGSYIIDNSHSKEYLEIVNNMNLNYYLCLELLGNVINLTKKEKERLVSFYESYYLTEELEKYDSSLETVGSYVKRIVK